MLSPEALMKLRNLLSKSQVISDPAELITYEIDAAQERGHPDAVVLPASVEEVRQVVRWAAEQQVCLISRGAGTGLSGGAVAEQGGVIVEFSRLNRVLELDLPGRSAVVEPGVINTTLDELVKASGYYYPPDPASGRSATLGGNVAENAGGPHCFKYGVTTNYLTGLELVLADGRCMHTGGRALDYPEYDFTTLLAGSEGTLALITGISVRLLKNPPGTKTLMAAFDSVEEAGKAVSAVIAAGITPATMEMMDQKIAQIVEDFAHPGIPTQAGALLIVDVDGYPDSLDAQAEEVSKLLAENGGFDLRQARTAEERDQIWYARKSAAGAMARLAPAYLLLDGTVPRSRLAAVLEATNRICESRQLRVGYVFHAGDGNLHPFILMYPDDQDQVRRVYQAGKEFMEEVVRQGGSITGEHGVGIEKRSYLSLMYTPDEIRAMLDVKDIFDPKGRLNPGKIFPEIQGSEQIIEDPGQPPEGVWTPASGEEAARGLAALTQARRSTEICGGHPKSRTDSVILSAACLNQIKELSGDDLYVTAGAGMRLSDLQDVLRQKGMWLPAFSPWEDSTLGGLLASNLNGPLRMRYGGLRDQVLAMTVALADGRLVRMGRPVVKNVAGYDLARFMVGGWGTLGFIVDATLKFTALPRLRRSVFIPVQDLRQGFAWGQACLSQALVASAIVLCKDIPLPGFHFEAPYLLVYTAEGLPEDVQAELKGVSKALRDAGAPEPSIVEDANGNDCWTALFEGGGSERVILRAGLAPKDLAAYVRAQEQALECGPFLADIANGFVYATAGKGEPDETLAWIEKLRKAALNLGGYCLAVSLPAGLEGKVDRWGYRPETLDLMQRLKQRWDPAGILGDLYTGLGA